jgi:hypothetical protein
MTGDKKTRRSGADDSYSQELATYLNLLDEAEHRLTPERVAGKLGDLLDHVSSEQTPEDTPPSGEGGGTSGSLGFIVVAGAAAWYLARRRARKMQPQWHPGNLDPAAGRGEDTHMQEERLW